MESPLFFFPDTNLFVQCKPLQEIDWSVWGNVDEIRLFVTRPIQAEIDSQKGKGAGRLAKRARATSSLFREAILAESNFAEVRAKNPSVRLYVRQDLKMDLALAEQLSYGERDDQLVGIAASFAKSNPAADVRILTHDTGPMASAKMVGVAFEEIPDAWLLAPETDEVEKRVNALQSELTRYKKIEPSFSSSFESPSGNNSTIESEIVFYSPLEDGQIRALMNRIEEHFPAATNFGPSESQERESKDSFPFFQIREVFTPADVKEIVEYKNERYPAWLRECESLLRDLHKELANRCIWPDLTIRLRNTGSRPAENTLVTFSARGAFQIFPKRVEKKEESIENELEFSPPPLAPQGQWSKQDPFATLNRLTAMHVFPKMLDVTPSARHSLYARTRDSEGFYWKPSRPEFPTSAISLECQLWRHQIPDEFFHITVHAEPVPAVITGVLEVVVHAANMTDAFVDRKPLHIVVIQEDPTEKANELVQRLIDAYS